MKINCVISNYNSTDTTGRLVRQIREYDSLDQTVVVGNASTDGSAERLKELEDEKVVMLTVESNRGYGVGDNLGVGYSSQVSRVTHVVIVNPDTSFMENCVLGMNRVSYRAPDVGVVATTVEDAVHGTRRNGWLLRSLTKELLSTGPVSRRLFGRLLEHPESYYRDKTVVCVDAVHGSMLMMDGTVFTDCGDYDENIFLYQEEAVLGWKMKQAGYRAVPLLDCRYLHKHSVSISKTYRDQIARRRLYHGSTMCYFKHYPHINRLQKWIVRVWFWVILLEIRVVGMAFHRIWRQKENRRLPSGFLVI